MRVGTKEMRAPAIFAAFFLLNSALTYVPLALPWRWAGIGCLAVLFAAACSVPREREADLGLAWTWPWTLLGAAGLALRFQGLGDPGNWFYDDESLLGVLAVEKRLHWDWNLFGHFSEGPLTPSFLSAPLFTLSDDPFFNLKFPTALVSSLSLIPLFFLWRDLVGRTLSLLLTLLMAVSYWPVYLGQFTHAGVWMPLLETAALWAFQRLRTSPGGRERFPWACLLGLVGGLGILAYTSWFSVLALVLGGVGWTAWKEGRGSARWVSAFGCCLALALMPLGIHAWYHGYGRHISAVSLWAQPSGWNGWIKILCGYGSLLFWGVPKGVCVPPWGGFLDPLLGSFFLWGAASLWRSRTSGRTLAAAGSFLFFLLPGLVSSGIEAMRILPLLLPLLFITALGFRDLLALVPGKGRVWAGAAAAVLSLSLDIGRLVPPRQVPGDAAVLAREDIRAASYPVLSKAAAEGGPGLLFFELLPETLDDLSLTYSSYPFNADWNPRWRGIEPGWFGVLAKVRYMKELSRRFPKMRWSGLTGVSPVRGPLALGIAPIEGKDREVLEGWRSFYRAWWDQTLAFLRLPNGSSREGLLRRMVLFYPSVPEDPYLQACYFERTAFNYVLERKRHPRDLWVRWENLGPFLERVLGRSCERRVLGEEFARVLASNGWYGEAQEVFETLLRSFPGDRGLEFQAKAMAEKVRQGDKVPPGALERERGKTRGAPSGG